MIETDEMSFSGTLWPVHMKPQEDELLSSWLTRLALAHGQTVASFTSRVWPGRILVARDVDLWNDPGIFETLSIKTGTPPARVFAATLASYEGWLFDKPRQCHLPWALPRYLNISPHRPFGLQFCPWCLASDKEPYFRRGGWPSWFCAHYTVRCCLIAAKAAAWRSVMKDKPQKNPARVGF